METSALSHMFTSKPMHTIIDIDSPFIVLKVINMLIALYRLVVS